MENLEKILKYFTDAKTSRGPTQTVTDPLMKRVRFLRLEFIIVSLSPFLYFVKYKTQPV